jgi:hypothetical protein
MSTHPFSTGDTLTNAQENEIAGAILDKTSGDPLVDPQLLLKFIDQDYGDAGSVASNTIITLTKEAFFFNITGATNIGTINTLDGRRLKILKFAAPLKLLNTGNIKTIDGTDFQVYQDSIIIIYQYDASNWMILASNNRLVNETGGLASAGTITVGKNLFYDISGITDISNINPVHIGKKIILKFNDNLTLLNTGNIKNAGNLDFPVYSGVTVDLYQYDASNWIITNSNKLLTKPKFEATVTTNQTNIPTSTPTLVNFDNIAVDSHNGYNITLKRYVVKVNGRYSIKAQILMLNISNGALVRAEIRKNGGVIIQDTEIPGSTKNVIIDVGGDIDLIKDDYIDIYIYHESVAARDLSSIATSTRFTGILIN